jgi:CheY-like chemotaxis protein
MTAASGLSVLLVEDEFMVALDAEQMLKDLGATKVEVASTFDTAVRCARDGAFDLVVLDVNLNGQLSFPIVATIRQRGIPVILATGYELRGRPGGAPDDVVCLAKPYSAARLEEAVSAALQR